MKQPQALIFDMDGTLFKTESILDHTYHQTFQTLKEKEIFEKEVPAVARMYAGIGDVLSDIWQDLLPDVSTDIHEYAADLMLEYELTAIRTGKGELYPHVKKTLAALHKNGYKLFVASNGVEKYVKGIVEYEQLGQYFTQVYSAGEFETSYKEDLVRRIFDDHNLDSAWMIGDRHSDVVAGQKNHIPIVGCAYSTFTGADELAGADYLIHDFAEILDLLAVKNS